MKIDVDTSTIEDYAVRIAKNKIRDQVNGLVKSEIDAIQNFDEMKNRVASLERRLYTIEQALKEKKWWK